MLENPFGAFVGMAVVVLAIIVAVAWIILPFIVISEIEKIRKLLTSIDCRLAHSQPREKEPFIQP